MPAITLRFFPAQASASAMVHHPLHHTPKITEMLTLNDKLFSSEIIHKPPPLNQFGTSLPWIYFQKWATIHSVYAGKS